ncbi:hypothetical protein HYDPIDRAFT_170174 [Hydnomerulius pinastri MD-312]|uniref:Unplaced genomic scaffold scaffold_37, whole genome shotgun sequence n=1 Tax=Hydnomerulius pinastri MD-312 TaxID=994086 RepID=A0A0C9W354_9AGAM|nr:hypothetical protein HYDPIDRAFT_170174 [Hydnomerulius pinastri MD-312]
MFELAHSSPLQLVSLVLAFVAVVYYVHFRQLRQKRALLPPGPPGSPRAKYQPRLIQKWIEEYGPVISLSQGNDVLVIVGRHQVVSDSVVWPRVVVASYIMLINVLELLERHECMTTGTQIELDWYSQVSTKGSLIRPGWGRAKLAEYWT